jgi:hypothetical protein
MVFQPHLRPTAKEPVDNETPVNLSQNTWFLLELNSQEFCYSYRKPTNTKNRQNLRGPTPTITGMEQKENTGPDGSTDGGRML